MGLQEKSKLVRQTILKGGGGQHIMAEDNQPIVEDGQGQCITCLHTVIAYCSNIK